MKDYRQYISWQASEMEHFIQASPLIYLFAYGNIKTVWSMDLPENITYINWYIMKYMVTVKLLSHERSK